MRLICSFKDQEKAKGFSSFLTKDGIDNKLEITVGKDWGSADYGDIECKIWIYDEDHVDTAMQWLEFFQEHPDDPRFVVKKTPIPFFEREIPTRIKKTPSSKRSTTPLTTYFLLACVLIFIIGLMSTPPIKQPLPNLPFTPLYSPPIKKLLLYDYPFAYELIDQFVETYGLDSLQNLNAIPPEGQHLMQESARTPHWQGFYDKIVLYLQNPTVPLQVTAPMFEKIRQGEVWRLFSPCLIHADIFHLFFNMIWLLVIGKQIEARIGGKRYLLFIAVAGIFSNTAQYFMTGPEFLGFSGVLCGMIAFVWVRQLRAPWEGYRLQEMTRIFIAFFVVGMVGVQVLSFFLEIFANTSIAPRIANTAHLSGALAGFLMARTRFFGLKS